MAWARPRRRGGRRSVPRFAGEGGEGRFSPEIIGGSGVMLAFASGGDRGGDGLPKLGLRKVMGVLQDAVKREMVVVWALVQMGTSGG